MAIYNFSAPNLAISVNVIGTPTFKVVVNLNAPNLAISVDILDAANFHLTVAAYNLNAPNLALSVDALDTPNFHSGPFVFIPTAFTSSSPAVVSPPTGGIFFTLSAISLTTQPAILFAHPIVILPIAFPLNAKFGINVSPPEIQVPPGFVVLRSRSLVDPFPFDPLNFGVNSIAGSDVLYRQGTGLEKALADVEAQRLIATYAELPRDQWDPYKINFRNLPYLAWAMGVNLWEDDWDETFQRWWVANQWTFKYERGSLVGIKQFVSAVGGQVVHALRPPFKFHPGSSWVSAGMAATGSIQFTQQPADQSTLTLNGTTITFGASPSSVNQIILGSTLLDTLQSLLILLINSNDAQLSQCTYALTGLTLTLTAKIVGVAMNSFTMEASDDSFAVVPLAGHLIGGVDPYDQRPAYYARFPQLRVYPFARSPILPWLCYCSAFRDLSGNRIANKNGCYLGPNVKFYATNAGAMSPFFRFSEIWDHGVVTPLTSRFINMVDEGTYVGRVYDEISIPASIDYHCDQKNKWPLPANSDHEDKASFGIFFGAAASNVIRIARDVDYNFVIAQAIYQTIKPDLEPMEIYPDHVYQQHNASLYSLFTSCESPTQGVPPPGVVHLGTKEYLTNKFLIPSQAGNFLYEVWYLFDPLRVPSYRKASVYMGQARFGIRKYTAELKVAMYRKWQPWFLNCGGHVHGFYRLPNTDSINKLRRAVTAAMAVRDTVRLNTTVMRCVDVADSFVDDGTYYVGEMVES